MSVQVESMYDSNLLELSFELPQMDTRLQIKHSCQPHTALLALQGVADKHADRQMADFISGNFLAEQIKLSKELSNHMTNLNRVGKIGHGEYHFDSDSLP